MDANIQLGAYTNHGMQITWDAVANAQGYTLTLVGRDGSEHVANLAPGATEHTFTGLDMTVEYQALLDVTLDNTQQFAGSVMAVTSKLPGRRGWGGRGGEGEGLNMTV